MGVWVFGLGVCVLSKSPRAVCALEDVMDFSKGCVPKVGKPTRAVCAQEDFIDFGWAVCRKIAQGGVRSGRFNNVWNGRVPCVRGWCALENLIGFGRAVCRR